MITEYRMDEKLRTSPMNGRALRSSVRPCKAAGTSGRSAKRRRGRSTVNRAFEKASAVMRVHRELLERGAQSLLEKETLTEADLDRIIATETPPRPAVVGADQKPPRPVS
jgi:ATP-dependent Zn protease